MAFSLISCLPLRAPRARLVPLAFLLAACSSSSTEGNAGAPDASRERADAAGTGGVAGNGGVLGNGGASASGGTAGAAASSGGSSGAGGGASGKTSCDTSKILCKRAAPVCDAMQVPSVVETCYGPCVPITQCGCTSAKECPSPDTYTCLMSAKHCTPYLE